MCVSSFGATVMRVVYGIEVKSKEDEYLSLAEQGNDIFQKAFVPGKYLLKHVPAWLPGAGFRRDAVAWREVLTRLSENASPGLSLTCPTTSSEPHCKPHTQTTIYIALLCRTTTRAKGRTWT